MSRSASKGSMSTRRGRPPGPAPPPAEDLRTPGIGQFFHQQPFALIFQQRMGGGASQGAGGASQGAGSQQDPVDLTGAEANRARRMSRHHRLMT